MSKISNCMKSKLFKIRLLYFVGLISLSTQLSAADVATGKNLFIQNCAVCHNKNMVDKLTGPALSGVEGRWGGDMKALYAWIRNSQGSIGAGQPRATAIWAEYKPTIMTSFPNLKDDEIASLLLYIKNPATTPTTPTSGGATTSAAGGGGSDDNTLLYGVSFLLLAALAVVLSKIISNLNRTAAAKEGVHIAEKGWVEILTSKTVVGFVIFALVVLGGYTTVQNAISLGRQQGYQPEQPIKFSHATHAGLNKIDCQYCHDGARRSKQSVIPATNTCMNCHKAIKVGSQYGTAELTKIYASIGFDPSTDKYIPDYDQLSQKDVEGIYKKWILSKYAEKLKLDTAAANSNQDALLFADGQWNDVKNSLTNDIKEKVQGPIEWKRIHNLPDHVYFNHSQHVTVGKVACQKCHGQVENMEVMKQYAPLSMGWCINCHRETEVKFADNDFYKSYARYHEEIKKGDREKVTVEDIGGTECQKCHY